jgi:hypothetical protein
MSRSPHALGDSAGDLLRRGGDGAGGAARGIEDRERELGLGALGVEELRDGRIAGVGQPEQGLLGDDGAPGRLLGECRRTPQVGAGEEESEREQAHGSVLTRNASTATSPSPSLSTPHDHDHDRDRDHDHDYDRDHDYEHEHVHGKFLVNRFAFAATAGIIRAR